MKKEPTGAATLATPPPPGPDRPRLSDTPPPPTQPPPPPTALQQRLDQVFGHAKRSFDKGDTEYAHTLFSQCVSEMPGSVVYLQHFRANLSRQAPGGKKDAKKTSRGLLKSKTSRITKNAEKGVWQEAFQAGCDALKKNPADVLTLHEMAAACDKLGHRETQLIYLHWALDAAPQDRETNRLAAVALEAIQEYEQAIACWRRILQIKKNDEEASKEVSRLSVEKVIQEGGYEPTRTPNPDATNPNATNPAPDDDAPSVATPRVAEVAQKQSPDAEDAAGDNPALDEPTLLAAVDASPKDPALYAALADFYLGKKRIAEAERLLAKAVRLAPDSLVLVEKFENVRLSRVQQAVAAAQQRTARDDSPDAAEAYRRTLKQGDQIELEVYAARAERLPGDPRRQFDLGVRLKRVGRPRDAIKALQAARDDSQRAAETQLYLGECFQQIKQFRLAATSYEASIEASARVVAPSETAQELMKLALYRAGVLAMGLGDLDAAEERLTELAGHDFGYRDVADRLDKIAQMRDTA